MKIYFSLSLYLCINTFSIVFAQNVIDLSDQLKEKRAKIDGNQIIILKDGSFQLMTQENFYKFDNNGKSLGLNEENNSSPIFYDNVFRSNFTMHQGWGEFDRIVKFDGIKNLDVIELFSDKPNVYHKIEIPKFEKPTNIKSKINTEIKWIDENNLLIAQSGSAYLPVIKKQSKKTNLYNSFIRILKVNIQNNSFTEKYFFIDKGQLNVKEFKSIFSHINFDDENNLIVDYIYSKHSIGRYSSIFSGGAIFINATVERWKIDFENDSEVKLGEQRIDEKPGQDGLLNFSFTEDAFTILSTSKTGIEGGYELKMKVYNFEDGEFKFDEIGFPIDVLSLSTRGIPDVTVVNVNGQKKYVLEGEFVYDKKGKISERKVVVLAENGDCLVYDISNFDHFYNYYDEDGNNVFISNNELFTPELREKLNGHLLKVNTMMSYKYQGNYFDFRKIDGFYLFVHADWRATSSLPDFKIELIELSEK